MRVIAGNLKGRKLSSPQDDHVRPTSDKVKEAMFNILQMYVADAVIVDLFCGSGGLGIEAVSRGAAKCYFCDKSRKSIKLTEKNLEHCNIKNEGVLCHGDFRKTLSMIKEKADIIFLDPPYDKGLICESIESIYENNILKENGVIVAEHSKTEKLSERLCGHGACKQSDFNSMLFEFIF